MARVKPAAPTPARVSAARAKWTFLSNHAHVLIVLAREPDARVRELATAVGITERAVQQILTDLESVGALTREKVGRRNRYSVDPSIPLRHPVEANGTIADILRLARARLKS